MAPTGKNRFGPLDASAFVRTESAAALTASGDGTYFDLGVATNEWHRGDVGAKHQFAVVCQVTDLGVTGEVTLAIKVANADESETAIFSETTVTEIGLVVLPIVVEQIQSVEGAEKLTVTATLSGTTPSVDFYAWVAPFNGH